MYAEGPPLTATPPSVPTMHSMTGRLMWMAPGVMWGVVVPPVSGIHRWSARVIGSTRTTGRATLAGILTLILARMGAERISVGRGNLGQRERRCHGHSCHTYAYDQELPH